jgi:hypothetical protein
MNAEMCRSFRVRLIELRKAGLLLLLSMLVLQAMAAERVTVLELEHAMAEVHGLPDGNAAQRLTAMELTERLTRARYERLSAVLPGEKSQVALLALADAAAFLDLPADDTLHAAVPDSATQGQMVSRAEDFVVATVSKMPDFFATRITTRFQDHRIQKMVNGSSVVSSAGFRMKDRSTDVVTFRNGREVAEPAAKKNNASNVTASTGLVNWGIFGPMLGLVMTDVMKGKIGWGHWEQGPAGPLAVFRFVVPKDMSNYTVRYCCFRSEEGEMREFEAVPAYHGEMAIDPGSGAVYRLAIKTELEPLTVDAVDTVPIERLDVLVEYGPVEIGGKTYICPIESTTISRAEAMAFHGYLFYVDKKGNADSYPGKRTKQGEAVDLPKVTAINDVVFENYHQFRAEIRILPGDVPTTAPDASPPH